jgi:O-antigen/teichoic acid export membrane protein
VGSDRIRTGATTAATNVSWSAGLRWPAVTMLVIRLRGLIRPVTLWNYAQLLGGSVGRLGLSLAYFLALTRSLGLADFGFFAGAVAVGTILARLAGFGYGANLLQVSATRPRALGHYMGIYVLWMLASLPVCFAVAWTVYRLSFATAGPFMAFLFVVASEAVVWRILDAVSVMNSGLGRFGFATAVYNIGTAGRAVAALVFLLIAGHELTAWSRLYFTANILTLVVVCLLLLPRIRPRYRRGTALLRWRNALALGGAGLASAAQVEVDKLLALTFGGPVTAGLYAICIRVIDLTAVPTRAFNVLMIQRVLTNPASLAGRRAQALTELGIALVSTAAYAAVLLAVHLWPGVLGRDIARAAGLLGLLWAVPALRNLTEYQAELLYAHGRMMMTLWVALILTAVKTALLAITFLHLGQGTAWVLPVNGVFLTTYAISAVMTYSKLSQTPANVEARP